MEHNLITEKVGSHDLPFEPTFNFSTTVLSPTPLDPLKSFSQLPFSFIPASFIIKANCEIVNIFVDSKRNKIFELLAKKSVIQSKISLVHFSKNVPSVRFLLFFSSNKHLPPKEALKELKDFKKELSLLLLAGPRKRHIKFVTEFFQGFKNTNKGVYHLGHKSGCTKWAVHDFILQLFFRYFPTFSIAGGQIFRDDWDALLHRSFTHWKFPINTLLNPPYLVFPTIETFLTLEMFVEHCIANLDAFCHGFAAILPAYASMKLKKNSSTFWAKRDNLAKFAWFLKFYNHPRIVMVLLDKKIKFLNCVPVQGKVRRQLKGLAPFHSVLVFFGFSNVHLLAQNTATSFINEVKWVSKLKPLQGEFQPRTYLSQTVQTKHTKWTAHAHQIKAKIAPNDLSLLSPKAQQGFVNEDLLEKWDWSPHIISYIADGHPIQNWDGKILNFPKLHADLSILYDYRKIWAKIPLQEILYKRSKSLNRWKKLICFGM